MPFGEFIEYQEFILEFPNGNRKILKVGGEYHAMFTSEVYSVNKDHTGETHEEKILHPEKHFENLGEEFVIQVNRIVYYHCVEHIFPHLSEANKKRCEAGFGGDLADGIIDWYSPQPLDIEGIPDISFEIKGQLYRMEWHYYKGEDDD